MKHLALASQEVQLPVGRIVKTEWREWKEQPRPHEFIAAVCPEDEGGYSIVAVHYPGVISQGDTIEEAKANIADAFAAMLEFCRNRGCSLDFSDAATFPPDCQKVWITVDG